jgi:hypothetical protein
MKMVYPLRAEAASSLHSGRVTGRNADGGAVPVRDRDDAAVG